MANKERENFYKNSTLIVDHTKNSLIDLLELHLSRHGLSFEDFINTHQHEIYHLCYNTRRCCQCISGYMLPQYRVLYPSQLELLLDKFGAALPCHVPGRRADFCCCMAKPGVTTNVLDITLTRTLLVNFCADVFWYSCLTLQSITLEDFLNQHQHHLYHLMNHNMPCCQCTPGYVFPVTRVLLKPHHWSLLFNNLALPCVLHRMVPSSNICCVSASSGIVTSQLGNELTSIILEQCCSLRKAVNKLVQMRNSVYGHATEGSISDTDYGTYKKELESGILEITKVCGKETETKQLFLDLDKRSLDETLCIQYQNTMLEQILKEKSLEQKVDELTKQLPMTVKNVVKEALNGDSKLTEEQRKRKEKLKETTLNQMKLHIEESTFVETHLISDTLGKLEQQGVVILTGTAGIGKSRNSIELLRRYCAEHEGYYALSLPKISDWGDLINTDDRAAVLIDDVFGRTNVTYDKDVDSKLLDNIFSTLSRGSVKLILTMRNTIKYQITDVTDSHGIFKQANFIDLSSNSLQMNTQERELCLLKHCQNSNIWKTTSYTENPTYDDTILDPSSQVYLSWVLVNRIVNTDVCPLLGFPQSCYLFASNRKFTRQGVAFFKHPTQTLCDEINTLRTLGRQDDSKALEYAVLVHILLNGDTLSLSTLNCQNIRQILESIYGFSRTKPLAYEIKNCVLKLSGRYLKIKGDNSACFQHRIIFESVLLSYKDIDPSLMISYLDLDSLLELGCLENYTPQMGEVTFKFYSESYNTLSCKLVSYMGNASSPDNFIKKLCASKFIRNGNKRFLEEFYTVYKSSKHDVHLRMLLLCSSQLEVNYWLGYSIDSGNPEAEMDLQRTDYIFTFLESLLRFSSDYTDNNNVIIYILDIINKDAETHNTVYLTERYSECLTLCFLKACFSLNAERLNVLWEFIIRKSITLDDRAISSFKMDRKGNVLKALKLMVSSCKNYEMVDVNIILRKVIIIEDIDLLKFMMDLYEHKINIQTAAFTACQIGIVNVVAWFCTQYEKEIDDVSSMMLTSCENGRTGIVKYLLRKFNHDLFSLDAAVNKAECYFDIVYVLLSYCKHPFDVNEIIKTVNIKAKCNIINLNDTTDLCLLVKYLLKTYDISTYDLTSVVEIAGLCADSSVLEILLQIIDVNSFYSIWIMATHFHFNRTIALKHIIYSSDCSYNMQKLIDAEVVEGNTDGIKLMLEKFDLKSLDTNRVVEFGCSRQPTLILWMFERFDQSYFDMGHILQMSLKKDTLEIAEWILENVDFKSFDMNSIINNASTDLSKRTVYWILNAIDHKLLNLQSFMASACESNNANVVESMLDMFDIAMFQPGKIMKFALQNLQNGFTDVVKLLLKKDNYSGNYDIIAVMNMACRHNKIDLVEVIVEHYSPARFHLQCAIKEAVRGSKLINKFDTLKYLLSRFDHIFLDVSSVIQDLCYIAAFDMVQWILNRFDQNLFDMNFIMNEACQNGMVRLVQWMFEKCKNNTFNMKSVFENACKNETSDLLGWLYTNFDYRQFEMKNVKSYSFRSVIFLIENCKHDMLDFNNILNYLSDKLDSEVYIEFLRCLLEIVDHKHLEMKLVFNHGCRYGTIHFTHLIMNTIDHRLLDFESAASEAVRNNSLEIVILILTSKPKYHAKLYVNSTFIQACHNDKLEIVDWLLYNFDLKCFNVYEVVSRICSFPLRNVNLIERIIETFNHDLIDFDLIIKSACRANFNGPFLNWLLNVSGNKITDPQSIMAEACNVSFTKWEFVKTMLDMHNFRLFDMKLILNQACHNGKLDIVKWLLKNYDNHLFDLKSALQHACILNKLDIVKFLVVSFDQDIMDIHTALQITLEKDFNWLKFSIIKCLLIHIRPSVSEIQLVMDNCCKTRDIHLAEWIMKSFDCNEIDVNSTINTIFDMNYSHFYHKLMIKFLLQHFNHKRFDMTTVIARMCKHRHSDLIFWVLENVEHSLFDAYDVLSEVCNLDDVEIMEYLVDTCHYGNIINEQFILNSFNTKSVESVVWLLNKFKNIVFDEKVALNNACTSGNIRLLQWLIFKHGTNSFDLKSAMNTACRYGGKEIVQWLLQMLHYETFDMETAMNVACEYGHLEIVKWFLAVYDVELFNMKAAILASEQNRKFDLAKWCREKLHLDKLAATK